MTDQPTRKTVRIPQYDYSSPGYYFITICTFRHHNSLGKLSGNMVHLSHLGKLAKTKWLEIPGSYPEYELDCYIFMPNHIHGLLFNVPALTIQENSLTERRPLGQVIRAFKSWVTRQHNLWIGKPGTSLWQRGFYEHVIRDERDLYNTRRYILNNTISVPPIKR